MNHLQLGPHLQLGVVYLQLGVVYPNPHDLHHVRVWVVGRTSGQCWGIDTQALLNIATAADRLGVTAGKMRPFAWENSEVVRAQAVDLNDVEIRQWQQVQRHCNKSGMRSRPYLGWR